MQTRRLSSTDGISTLTSLFSLSN